MDAKQHEGLTLLPWEKPWGGSESHCRRVRPAGQWHAWCYDTERARDRNSDGWGWAVRLDPRERPVASGPETGQAGRAKADEALARMLGGAGPAWSAEVEAEAGGAAKPDKIVRDLSGPTRPWFAWVSDYADEGMAAYDAATREDALRLAAIDLPDDDLTVRPVTAADVTGLQEEIGKLMPEVAPLRAALAAAEERDEARDAASRAVAAAEEAAALVAQAQDKAERALTAGEAIASRLAAAVKTIAEYRDARKWEAEALASKNQRIESLEGSLAAAEERAAKAEGALADVRADAERTIAAHEGMEGVSVALARQARAVLDLLDAAALRGSRP
jgi:hypothetical protein